MGSKDGVPAVNRDLELEEDCPGLCDSPYTLKSPRDPVYNCIAFAVGDLHNWWDDLGVPDNVRVNGYYWPPGIPDADSVAGWIKVFEIHGYKETDDASLEPDYEKVAIYGSDIGAEHVARQKASGIWVSKMGKGVDIEHTLEGLEGDFPRKSHQGNEAQMSGRKAGIGMKEKPIPEPTEELKAQCNAENQFSNFDRAFRAVMAVPKSEILGREARELHRNARKRAKKKKTG